MRIGIGYDVHELVEGRKLIIGGVSIPFEKGLLGHSDADVLVHAIMDSILGALGCGDIGKHFPDTDARYRNISSLILLERVHDIMRERGYRVGNVDTTVIAQRPKLAPYIEEMKENIGKVLGTEDVNIKATTTEQLGFEGRGEGMAAYSVCILLSNG